MSRKFGKKITLMGLLAACILMATVTVAMAVVVLGNVAPVAGWHNINTNPARDSQNITLGVNQDVATVDVLIRTVSPLCGGNIPVDLIIHDVTAGGPTIATANATIPNCYTGNVAFAFPGVGPVLIAGNQYDIQVNTPANPAVTTLSWAFTANILNPQIGLSVWDFAPIGANDFRFRIHV